MNAHTRRTYEAITQGRAPRELEWNRFVSFWNEVADDVEQGGGNQLVVHVNGHRQVFRRPHNGLVSLEDIEHARHLLAETPPAADAEHLIVVTIDATQARLITFDLGDGPTTESSRTIRDGASVARRLRTVERKRGRDDVHILTHFFDEVAAALDDTPAEVPIVVLGAGHGKADEASSFAERLQAHHPGALADRLRGVGHIDLSAASDTDIQAAALDVMF